MFSNYRINKEIRQRKEAEGQRILEAREKEIATKLHKFQLSCRHEFGDVTPHRIGTTSFVGHLVVCKKCALRREV